jgi:hypothetical protein
MFAMVILVNLGCFILILRDYLSKKNWFAFAGIGCWMFLLFMSLEKSTKSLPITLKDKRKQGIDQEANVKQFLTTGKVADLKNKKRYSIPYPDPDRLAMILSWQEIKDILPTNVRPAVNPPSVKSGRLDGTTNWMLAHYVWFGLAGMVGLFAIAVYRVQTRKPLSK